MGKIEERGWVLCYANLLHRLELITAIDGSTRRMSVDYLLIRRNVNIMCRYPLPQLNLFSPGRGLPTNLPSFHVVDPSGLRSSMRHVYTMLTGSELQENEQIG